MTTLEQVKAVLGDLPWMSFVQAQFLRRHLVESRLKGMLELGHMHGVSTCYLASVAQELGGSVTTIDLPRAAAMKPNLETLLQQCGLADTVTIRRSAEGAGWLLREFLHASEVFDFIYIDADHTWEGAGFQFFLCLKLLRPGGWILFDDIRYSLATSASATAPWVLAQSQARRETYQVREVWEMLVKPHPDIVRTEERGNWGLCQKRP